MTPVVGETAREDPIPSDKAPGAERVDRLGYMILFQLDLRDVCHNSSECNDHDYIAPTMSQNNEAGWFRRIIGYVASLSPEQSTPQTANSQRRDDAWVRTDAYLQYENQDFESLDPQLQASALRALNNCVQVEQNHEVNFNFNPEAPYPNLEAANRILQRDDGLGGRPLNATISLSKRKRDRDPLLEEFRHMDTITKKRRIIVRDNPEAVDNANAPEADFAIRARKQSMSLYQGLRTHWTCFFQPLEEDSLPDITKPFLDMKRVPVAMPNRGMVREDEAGIDTAKHMVHPNASVLALGILLCELHYCKPIEAWQDDPNASQNVNSAYYTSLEVLRDLEDDAGLNYYLATKACLQWEYLPAGEYTTFESAGVQKLFYQNVVKRLESEILSTWEKGLENLQSLSAQEIQRCWGRNGCEVIRQHTARRESVTKAASEPPVILSSPDLQTTARRYSTVQTSGLPRSYIPMEASQSLQFFDANHQKVSEQEKVLSDRWMDSMAMTIYKYVGTYDKGNQSAAPGVDGPVRIAILDSGFDPDLHFVKTNEGHIDPRIKDFRNFVAGQNELECRDEIGHGTHALGLLLKVATCAEIFIARIANQATLGRDSYSAISKAVNHAVSVWKVDVISMSFGIREFDEDMMKAIQNARANRTLMFAAASNDGANHGRAFPAKDSGVFCIHSSDANGRPSRFNPIAEEDDVNFCLLGENVESHWPVGTGGHNEDMRVMSGTSVATPIAAGIAVSLLSLVRQQEKDLPTGSDRLGWWLKDFDFMKGVLKSMRKGNKYDCYDYIPPHFLSNMGTSREDVYNRIKQIRGEMLQ
ncbi:Uncharacterized protein LW93_6189 [Fusarium fujikuroi]|nr:Uncharacterized protein LW93_6189 [Fusarium fujikuroi]